MSQSFDHAERLKTVLDVAKAMISERDLDVLLQMILREASRVVDADRGSLFLVDPESGELWTKIAHGIEAGREIRIPRGVGLAGHVAMTGELVNLADAYDDPRFNRQVDRDTGYRTHALLCIPMMNMRGEVVGVLQALNKHSGAFTSEDADLLLALGGQAAAAIENALLHDEIQKLFEGFVRGAVVTIEARDPSTAGHSERVARLTLGLADAIEATPDGRFGGLRFGAEQRMEIRYAALLHDFGKVGVREDVLVKAQKLYPHQLDLIRQRFEYAKKSMEAESLRRQLVLMQAGAPVAELQAEDAAFRHRAEQLDSHLELVLTCNRPTVLAGGHFESLDLLQHVHFAGANGEARPLLAAHEVAALSIRKGSLSVEERREIESHVGHTYRFLTQIPWTRNLRRVPEIAYGHHEKLDGSGYPLGLTGDAIAVEARMMAIADIYDALTASDRPYKKAVPHDIAVRILHDEVTEGHVDAELLAIFIDQRVPEQVLGPPSFSDGRRVSGAF
jgi:HD-GYP domain-containing protein (c-di-GMP phosphodiesterase class II)